MKNISILLWAIFLPVSNFASESRHWQEVPENPDYIHRAIKQVTDVMVQDVFSPPVASRIYAYTCIAGYEAAIHGNPAYSTLAGQLHALAPVPQPEPDKKYCYSLASAHAILTVGKTLVFSEDKIKTFHIKLLQECKAAGLPQEILDNSLSLGQQVAAHILAWASLDNYKQTRAMPIYSPDEEAHTWKPTPPTYMKAVEPYWSKMRTFVIDSAAQFKPLPPASFSSDTNSTFFKEAREVYQVSRKLTPEQQAIASFWDCNPFKMNINGHVMYATKKISPGGHWMNITGLACRKANADFREAAEAYAYVALTLADGFISCWDEKYRSRVIRPETYINQYIDESWVPLLQTPPFPEYTSGHSVVSAASALMLTKLFGENFSFADSTEVEFGLPVRHFTSFKQAAEEAAISRLYGGIHYRPSVINGTRQGTQLASFISRKVKTRKKDMAQTR